MPYVTAWDNHGGNRQPNFLQKLFDFLALDPHPCPEVIYWAADSRQLVIAQPDRLAKEVLPRLFKHDKISSFGRQLNIYGFSSVFPGRQFKDAQGRVLDASVWAHSTLHRLSTAGEIANVKRRAAPKLFRTRRLANGQVVRSKAGPEVEKRYREVKEGMAGERRRGTWADHTATPVDGGRVEMGNEDGWNQEWELHAPEANSGGHYFSPPGTAPLTYQEAYNTPTQYEAQTPMSHGAQVPMTAPPYTSSYDHGRVPLSSITEGKVSYDATSPFWDAVRSGHTSLHHATPGRIQGPGQDADPLTTPTTGGGKIQSCPASIHTSPVMSTFSIAGWGNLLTHIPEQPAAQGGHRDSIDSITSQINSSSGYTYPQIPPANPGDHGTGHGQGMRIAAPAAPNPFDIPRTVDVRGWNPSFLPSSRSQGLQTHDGWGLAGSKIDSQAPSSISSIFSFAPPGVPAVSMEYHEGILMAPPSTPAYYAPEVERRDTIDPRWISPISSLWHSPSGTPARARSPALAANFHIARQLEAGEESPSNCSTLFHSPAAHPALPEVADSEQHQDHIWTNLDPFRRQSDLTGLAPAAYAEGGTQSYPPRVERKGLGLFFTHPGTNPTPP